MLKLVQSTPDTTDPDHAEPIDLDELCRVAAQQMLATALLSERQAYLDAHAGAVDDDGKRLVVANGYAHERNVVTGAGPVTVEAPRVNDKRDGEKFSSNILPAYMRRSPKVTEVLPILYLRGLSTGDFAPALSSFLGSDAGLSPSTISRLCETWQGEHARWEQRNLTDSDFVYWWADGVHFNVRLEQDRLACLVIVGVRADGTKELVALADGYREDTQTWLDLLRSLRDRGLTGPNLAVGDGALGFWAALREVYPETIEQRCWVHKTANVLAVLPKRLQPQAKKQIHAIYNADTQADAINAVQAFADHHVDFPKAAKKIVDDLDTLLAFYDFPAEHWIHLRTTNPIESTFATVRLRTRSTRGAGSRQAALAMGFKLMEAAQDRWRKINAPQHAQAVRNGTRFVNGKLSEATTNKETVAA